MGVRKRGGGGGGGGIKAVLEREMYRKDGGDGGAGGGGEGGHRGPHWRPGQCQGSLAEAILVSPSRDKTALPPPQTESVGFLTRSDC